MLDTDQEQINLLLLPTVSNIDPRRSWPCQWWPEDELAEQAEEAAELKACAGCRRDMPGTADYFVRYRRGKNGLGAYCLRCNHENTRAYKARNPEKYLAGIRVAQQRQFAGAGIANEYWIEDGVVHIVVLDRHLTEHVVLIDAADLDLVTAENTRWFLNNQSYPQRLDFLADQPKLLHVVVMGGTKPGLHIDHADRNRLNNRRSNLRFVTRSQNAINHKLSSRNTSGYPGVVWRKNAKCWRVQVRINRKTTAKEFRDFTAACEYARSLYIAAGVPATNLPAIPIEPAWSVL